MSAVIYDPEHVKIYGIYKTKSAARTVLNNALEAGWKIQGRKYPHLTLERLDVVDAETFRNEIDHEITVTNAVGGGHARIMKSEQGGPCDPSTERYWSM